MYASEDRVHDGGEGDLWVGVELAAVREGYISSPLSCVLFLFLQRFRIRQPYQAHRRRRRRHQRPLLPALPLHHPAHRLSSRRRHLRLRTPDGHMSSSEHGRAGEPPGVVDPKGKVWRVEGLYVADASVFPSASGVNPMVTNMAVCDMISRGVVRELRGEGEGVRARL